MNYSEALERHVAALQGVSDPKVKDMFLGNWQNPEAVEMLKRSWPGMVWSLERSESIYVGREICNLLGAVVSRGVPPWTLHDDLPLVPRGFCWFETNPGYRDETDPDADLAALSWAPYWVSDVMRDGKVMQQWSVSGPVPGAAQTMRALMIHPWYAPSARQLPGRPIIAPWLPLVMTFGSTSGQWAPVTLDGVPRESASPLSRSDGEFLIALFGAFSLFSKQQIFTSGRELAERHVRKRLARAGSDMEPLVRVVRLRARVPAPGSAERGEAHVDWACRWMVRGHWRQQFFPTRKAHQPIWISPHIKGPDNKPLKAPRATVFAVVQ